MKIDELLKRNEQLEIQNTAQHNMIEWMEERIEQLEEQLKSMFECQTEETK